MSDRDVLESVNDIKVQGDGFITLLGSGQLAQTLIEHGLRRAVRVSRARWQNGRAMRCADLVGYAHCRAALASALVDIVGLVVTDL